MPPDQAVALTQRAARQAVSVRRSPALPTRALATIPRRQAKDGYRDAYERAFQPTPNDPFGIKNTPSSSECGRPRDALKVFEPRLVVDPANAVVCRDVRGSDQRYNEG